jgi:hypothetical protein
MDKSKYRLLYFIPPELRKHVEFVKGLPRIIADTVTDPNTYTTLNQMLNPVEWVIAPVRNTRKFIDSGYKDVGALTNATIETLGLAAGPLAHKYASTLSPVASKGVSSGVKSLQELVMPLGASDDVAKEVSKRTGVNRRQFIAGTAALGAASGLKGVGDIFPTPKVIKATVKSPILKSITRLSKLNKKFKETSNEISDPQMSGRYFRNKEEALKEQNEILEQEENLGNVVSSINQEFKDLENNILEKGYEGVSKLTKEELINLRKLFTDSYSIDRRFTAPDSYTRGYERSVVVTDEMGNKKLSNFVPVNDIINKALKKKGLTDLDTFVKIREPITTKYSNDPMYKNGIKTRKDAEKLGVEDEYIYGLDDRIIGSKTIYRIRDEIPEVNIGNEKPITQRITEVNEQTEQALTKAADKLTKEFNKGGMSMEQQMSLFEEGGMKDDGLDRDPVSGNEIPPGSLAKEVRDDIPAQLSDGEYVVPADVVQYYGVKFFEDLRAEAKSGLAQMEATGRIGGEPMAVDMTMIAFGQRDEDKKEKKATGGVVGFDNGGVSSDMQQIEKSRTFNPADYAVLGFTPGSSISQVRSGVQTSAKPTSTVVYRTYYGPNNEVKSVPGTLDANGNWNADQGFEEFVKSPWTNTPKQQVSSSRDGSSPSALELEAQRRQNEYALGVSAKRLGIPLEEYKDLSLGKRFKLMGQEIQVMSGGKADPKIVKSILDGKDDGFNFTDLIGFIFNPIGSVIKLATSFIAGTDISDSPASNVQLKNKSDGSEGGVDPNWRKKAASENKTGKDRADDDSPDTSDFSPTVKNQQMASAVKAGVSTKTATELSGSKMKPGTDVGTGKDGADKIGPQNKGGLIQRPKRKNKK